MDIIRVFNGLGNQMSQYAFYLAKKRMHPLQTFFITNKYASENIHNGYELGRVFGIKSCRLKESVLFHIMQSMYVPVWGYRFLGRFAHSIEESPNYDYDAHKLDTASRIGFTFYWGGWHSEKYFAHIRKDILEAFKFDESKLNGSTKGWREIIMADKHSCSLHIRRGDFLKDKKWADAISDGYYERAIKYMRNQCSDIHFYVFSNDLEWCKKHFGNSGFFYVEGNDGLDSWQDMFLMTKCHHHINANSSFSWWGAWLCTDDNSITIVPSMFRSDLVTKDIYPERWLKL